MRRAHALDPLSVSTNFHVGFQAWQGGDRDLAARQLRLVASSRSSSTPPRIYSAESITWRGISPPREGSGLPSECSAPPGGLCSTSSRSPPPPPPCWTGSWRSRPVPSTGTGSSLYALLGMPDRALTVLESHFRNVLGSGSDMAKTGPSLAFVATDPFFDPLRSEPGSKSSWAASVLELTFH